MIAGLIPGTLQGLPVHALVVHFTVVGLPLTTLALLLCAFSGQVRARVGVVLPIAGIGCLVLVPITTATGRQLKAHVYNTVNGPIILRHQHAASQLLPWTIGLAVMSVVVYLLGRFSAAVPVRSVEAATTAVRARPSTRALSTISTAITVVAAVVGIGTAIQVSYVGHLGSEAVWNGYSQLPVQKNVPGGG